MSAWLAAPTAAAPRSHCAPPQQPAAPAPAAGQPEPGFYEQFRALPPGQRDKESLKALLGALAQVVANDILPPADAPTPLAIEQGLRDAVRAQLTLEWRAYLEYLLASNACLLGDLAAMSRAAQQLALVQEKAPDLRYYAGRRGVLLADLQRALGDFAAALGTVERVLRDPDVTGDPVLQSDALGLYSEVLRETGRLDDATAVVLESLAMAKRSGDPKAIERALVRDQAMALATGRFKESRAAIDQQLATLDADPATKDADRIATRALLLVFRGYAESGAADADPSLLAVAKATLDEARAIAKGHLQVRADLKRVELALRAEDPTAALEALADCERSLGPRSDHGDLPRDEIERIGLVTQLRLLQQAPLAELQRWLPEQRRAEQALAAEWRRQPPSRGGIGFLHLAQRRELLAAGVALELRLAAVEQRTDGPARALQILVDLQAETSLARARGATRCQVAELQRELRTGERGALVFLPSRRATYTFLLEGELVTCVELAGNRGLAKVCGSAAARLLRSPVVHGPERELRNDALRSSLTAAAEQLLPAPLRARVLALDGLTVVGADLLEGLPLEALLLGDGRLLGEVVPIDNTGSLPLVSTLMRATRPTPAEDAKVLIAGCTRRAEAFAAAAAVENFVFPIEVLQPGLADYRQAIVRRDAEVTRELLLGPLLRNADIVHVIAHHLPGSGPNGGGRLVAHDDFVARDDLDRHPVRGLTIVSACGGGQGPLRSGEGEAFASFAGSFLWNGAHAVIASRNELLVLDHLRLMRHVHKALAADASPARALQTARAAVREGADLVLRTNRAVVQVFGAGHAPLLQR